MNLGAQLLELAGGHVHGLADFRDLGREFFHVLLEFGGVLLEVFDFAEETFHGVAGLMKVVDKMDPPSEGREEA
jgi:hypothetical protein